MAQFFGGQSEYLSSRQRFAGTVQKLWIFALGVSAGLLVRHLWPQLQEMNFIIVATALVILLLLPAGFVAWRYLSAEKEEGQFFKGIEGESKTYVELKKLPDDFDVFQDVKILKNNNIDFVVLSPTTLFSIEVKNISGDITVNDNDKLLVNGSILSHNPVNQAYSEAKQIEEASGISAVPILVLAGNVEIHLGMKKVRGVHVISQEWLNKLLTEEHYGEMTQQEREQVIEFLKEKV